MISNTIRSKSPLGTIGQMKDFLPDEWTEDYYEMTDKLEEIKHIEVGDKIGKIDNKYYIHKSGMASWLARKLWYQENRENTIEYLNEDFKKMFRFLDKVIYNTQNDVLNIYNKYNMNIIDYVKNIIPGLYNLKQTYENEGEHYWSSDKKKIIATIDSIILTLFDFNKQMIDLNHRSKENYKKYGGMYVPKVRAYSDTLEGIMETLPNSFSI